MIITLSHQKGGVGKSTIAWNLALYFEKLLPTTIIDLDIQQSLTQTNQIRSSTGLKALHVKQIDSSDALAMHIQNDNNKTVTIVDSGGFDSAYNRIAITGSDMLITPVSDKPFDLMGLQRYEEILKSLSQIQGESIKTNILFNNLNPAMKNFGLLTEFICVSEHFELMTSVIRQRSDIAHSIGGGQSIQEYRPHSKASSEFGELFQEVKQKINI